MNKIKYIVVALVAIAGMGFQAAKADYIFNLNVGNSAISSFSGPYAQVDVHQIDMTHATVTFTSLTNSGNIYLMGDGGSVGLNVVGSGTFTVTGSNSGTGFNPGPYTSGGPGHEDGFGLFNLTVNSFDGFTHSSDHIVVNLTSTSGGWADAMAVLFANSLGNKAAAHIFVTTSPANASNGAIVTGFASGVGTVDTVPDGGATVMLLGLALGGLGIVRRYLTS